MGLFSKKPDLPPGVKEESNGYVAYWTPDPGPHTCEFLRGQQINRTTVRFECTHCDATQDSYSPDPGN